MGSYMVHLLHGPPLTWSNSYMVHLLQGESYNVPHARINEAKRG